MSGIDTPAAALALLSGVLAPSGTPAVTGIDAFYDHERKPGQGVKAAYMTLFFSGMTPTEFEVTVRIYQTVDVDVQAAQTSLAQMTHDTDRIIKNTSRVWRPEWTVEFAAELDALIASGAVLIGREDYSLA